VKALLFRPSLPICLLGSGIALLGLSGCVDAAAQDRASFQLAEAQRAVAERDQRIQALNFQFAQVTQLAQTLDQKRQEDLQALGEELRRLQAENAALIERVKSEEREKLACIEAAEVSTEAPRSGKGPACSGLRAEDLRKLELTFSRRVAEMIQNLEKHRLLRNAADSRVVPEDLIDPWSEAK